MEMGSNLRAANPTNYQIVGRVSLWFRKKGDTNVADFFEFGNIIDPSFAPLIERLDHFSQRRGVRAKDRSEIISRSATLNFTIDEINQTNLLAAFGASETPEDAELALHDSKSFDNPGGTAPSNTCDLNEEDIDEGTVVVRTAGIEEEETFTEDVDYSVDYADGVITILPGGALNDPDEETGIPKIHVYYQKTVETVKSEIFDGTEIEGEAQFQVLTKGGAKYAIQCGNVVLKNNGDITYGDGQDWQKIALSLDILEDTNGELGQLHRVSEGELEPEE
jgi:hypothetical protein